MSKSKKLPALQFYPGDWRKDIGVQSLSFHDRGVWFEMLMIMHDSERRGVLVLNGRSMADESIARAIGLDNQTFNQTLTTLLTSGVADREPNGGAVFSRRMVRDENLRQVRSESGSKGGNPALLNQNLTTPVKQSSTPSSSVSFSPSVKAKAPRAAFAIPDWCDREAWKAYEEMRVKIRKPMTNHARGLAVIELTKLRSRGHDPTAVLNQSTMHSWQGLFEPKGEFHGTNQGNGSTGTPATAGRPQYESPAHQRERERLTALANIAGRRYGRGPLAPHGGHDGAIPFPGADGADAGNVPGGVGGDDHAVRNEDVGGRVIDATL